MRNLIFYCHGYGSSKHTDKVRRLRAAGDVFAWDIDIDPDKSIPTLIRNVEDVLLSNEYLNADIQITFVGTSLGAWYAANLANRFSCNAIIINPATNPKETLEKYGVDSGIRDHYEPIWAHLTPRTTIIVSDSDEIIDHTELMSRTDFIIVSGSDHRFNGPEFEQYVVSSLKKSVTNQ